MTTEVDPEFLLKSKRVGNTLVELCEERGQDYFGPEPLIGYSLEVNNTSIMLFAPEDRAKAETAYKRLIYALS